RAQRADDLAQVQDALRELLQRILQPDPGVEVAGEAALVLVVVPAHRHVVDAADPLAGQTVEEPVVELTEVGGLFPDLRLVLLDPQGLAGHPLRRDVAIAVVLEGIVAAGGDAAGLGGGAHVHPDDCRAKRLELLIEEDDRAAGEVAANADNRLRVQAGLLYCAAYGTNNRGPPLVGALLCPAGFGVAQRVGFSMRCNELAVGTEDSRTGALRPTVDAY